MVSSRSSDQLPGRCHSQPHCWVHRRSFATQGRGAAPPWAHCAVSVPYGLKRQRAARHSRRVQPTLALIIRDYEKRGKGVSECCASTRRRRRRLTCRRVVERPGAASRGAGPVVAARADQSTAASCDAILDGQSSTDQAALSRDITNIRAGGRPKRASAICLGERYRPGYLERPFPATPPAF